MQTAQARARYPTETPRFDVSVARTWSLVTQAQRLRTRMTEGAALFDEDRFEPHCEYLVVRDVRTEQLVGTCRILSPRDALRAGGHFAESAFDLALLVVLRDRMIEMDRPAIDPSYRVDGVVAQIWTGLTRYLLENRLDYVLACADVSTRDGGHVAASLHRIACAQYLSPEDYRVFPRQRLPFESLSETRNATPPPIFKSLIERGAWVCGEPAYDQWGDTASFPMLLPLARMQERSARQFLSKAL